MNLLRIFILLLLASAAHAQTVTQTFALHPGWNSIWLEVEPPDRKPATVFAGLPVTAVWTYIQDGKAVDFIANQAEAQFNQPGWLSWFPTTQPEAFLTSLFAVPSQRAYLVKATTAATLTVTGRPVVKDAAWVPDSFNLRGFAVNPALLPTFGTYFAGVAAHEAQRKYRLSNTGVWELVTAGDAIEKGVAYWVFSSGASTFQGSLNLENLGDDSLDFSTLLTGLTARLRSNDNGASTVTITDLGGASSPLSVQGSSSAGITYTPLSAPITVPLTPGETAELRLVVRRKDFAAANFSTVLEIRDNRGSRHLVTVTADKVLTARSSIDDPPPPPTVNATLAGLWIGTASVANVNEVNSSAPTNVTPTRTAFDLRMILHVTENGTPRMLKEVIQMWQPSTFTTNVAGDNVVDKPGRFVLLTRESLVPDFKGATLRSGSDVGRRLSTVDFDFDGGADNLLAMTGGFGIGQVATANITIAPGFATNPFFHKYHPDHDNLNATFTGPKAEAYQITRAIQLTFTPTDPGPNASATALDYGDNVLGGTYRETITGLHKRPLVTTGTFRIRRVSNSPVLNQ